VFIDALCGQSSDLSLICFKISEIDMSPDANVKLVLRYFEACNTGDLDDLKSTLAPNVVHYFLSELHPPIRGADHLARYWRKFREVYDPAH
jgi:hypothetical protein